MAAQAGRSFLVKMNAVGSPTADYETIGGFRTKSISINNSLVDITDQDSANWREILAAEGIQSVQVSGAGVFKDSAAETVLKTAALANTHAGLQIVVPGLGTFTGTFAISSLSYAGPHDDAQTFDVTFESNGAVTFA